MDFLLRTDMQFVAQKSFNLHWQEFLIFPDWMDFLLDLKKVQGNMYSYFLVLTNILSFMIVLVIYWKKIAYMYLLCVITTFP